MAFISYLIFGTQLYFEKCYLGETYNIPWKDMMSCASIMSQWLDFDKRDTAKSGYKGKTVVA